MRRWVSSLVLLSSTFVSPADATSYSGCYFVPAFRNGKPVGIKIFTIRPGYAGWALGLENGDVIMAVNDVATIPLDSAARIGSVLDDPKSITLEVERRGRILFLRSTLPSPTIEYLVDSLFLKPKFLVKPSTPLNAALLDLVHWKGALDDEVLDRSPPPPWTDPWGHPYRLKDCLRSVGADGLSGTDDDVQLACEVEESQPSISSRCRELQAHDAWGTEQKLIRRGENALIWSWGPDRKADTADDRVRLITGASSCVSPGTF